MSERQSSKRRALRTAIFALIVLAVVFTLYALSESPREKPALPDDADHKAVADWRDCLRCHGDGGPSPLTPDHPINKEQCFRCHTLQGATPPGR
ncbi:MAG: hypothetical protein C4523_19085 [Myxococcales bacterium]|nr:MAG: hypothetical protein C4523_19085 [Myxococcales bacterium]